MATKDGFNRSRPLPVFLADQAGQQGIGIARDRAATSSRVLKASLLIATATVIGIAVLWVGNPAALFADVTASLVGNSGLRPGTDQSPPTIQLTSDAAQALPPTARDTPTRNEIAGSDPAGQGQTEKSEPPPEALFRQFQAWAAEKDAQADVESIRPVQDAPARVVQSAPAEAAENARPSLRIMQKPRHVRPVRDARAETRLQNPRKELKRPQAARAQVPPAQDARAQNARAEAARAQDQPAPNAQAPSFLQTFGLRN
jgi:hypothetical protein